MSTWNSRTASWLNTARTLPTVASLLSRPSTVMLFDRARWPANVRPEVADAPCCGVRSVVTPGVMIENEMKLRPLIGRLAICCWETTVATEVFCVSTSDACPSTVTCSVVPASFSVTSRSTRAPSVRIRPSRVSVAKPASSSLIV